MTKKKVTRVESSETDVKNEKVFVPTEENKKKATTNRIIAAVLWVIAIGIEIFAIFQLKKVPINLTLIIILLVVDALFAIGGILLWKQSNRLDPASEKDKVRFFVQNQLGVIIAMIAFLPIIVLLLSNKDLDKKQKGIASGVAIVALAFVAAFGFDSNPASIEKYTQETSLVESLMGENQVYWTKFGRVYHLYDDCYTINTDKTTEIFDGKVETAYAEKSIEEICKICLKKAQAGTTTASVDSGHEGHIH